MINIEEGIEMGYDSIIYIFHDRHKNTFYKDLGDELDNVYDIFEYITPNDLYLYRHNPDNCIFPHRSDTTILIEILVDYMNLHEEETP